MRQIISQLCYITTTMLNQWMEQCETAEMRKVRSSNVCHSMFGRMSIFREDDIGVLSSQGYRN